MYLTCFSTQGFSILTGVGFLTIVDGGCGCSCYYFSDDLSNEALELLDIVFQGLQLWDHLIISSIENLDFAF